MLAQRYGLSGIWIAGLMAGILLLIIGILRLGRFIAFIPAPVISGFTSGIALIIFIGQIDSFLGIQTPSTESALFKLLGYFQGGFTVDWHAVVLGSIVVLTMLLWPARFNSRLPASLLGIVLATGLNAVLKWPVPAIGAIPQTLLLADRMTLAAIPWDNLSAFVAPALTITALGAVESLLCGAVASNMTGVRLQANQELVGQGIGNIVIPFFGGIPATAAIARTSVGIKSGGQTRLVECHPLAGPAVVHVLARAGHEPGASDGSGRCADGHGFADERMGGDSLYLWPPFQDGHHHLPGDNAGDDYTRPDTSNPDRRVSHRRGLP
ncbi:MAG: SulP family inorganic anion transporter [Candidatus Nanopelagicales bacterium]